MNYGELETGITIVTKTSATAKPGDLFAITLPDGRYGAIRILRQEGKSLLIAVTFYLDSIMPTISVRQLLTILRQNRFSFRNDPAISWYEGKVPKDIQYIGNIPITEQEKVMTCNSYSGTWDSSCSNPVYYEWRWIHDRESFENEILIKRE